jgi:hypothetical protein
MAYDMAVVQIAYDTAVSLGASNKIMLALFEAGIVESGFRNLDYGDSTSLGFLQQKPEYWGGKDAVMNPATATTSFITQAKKLETKYNSSGQLAQAVQKSAYPLRYDGVEKEAKALIDKVSNGKVNTDTSDSSNTSDSIYQQVFNAVSTTISKLGIYGGLVVIIIVSLAIVYKQQGKIKAIANTAVKAGKAYATGGASLVADATKGVK